MLVYFARPIDQADDSDSKAINTIARRISTTLLSVGLSMFRPAYAYHIAPNPISDLGIVDAINRSALGHCDAVVAYLPAGVATLGVPAEIELALTTNKPVLILTDQPLVDKSVQLWNWRERGASIRVWTPDLAAEWTVRPSSLTDLLTEAPYSNVPLVKPESERSYQQVTFGADIEGMGPNEAARHATSEARQLLLDQTEAGFWKANPDEELCPLPMYTDGKARQEITGAFYPNPGAALHVKLDEGAHLPQRGHVGDAGVDLAINENALIPAGMSVLVRTGVRVAFPVGYWRLIIGRSSAYAKLNLDVRLGVIDEGYRGELMLRITNVGPIDRTLTRGMRVGQLILLPCWQGDVIQTDELSAPRGRGESGWGSTGGHGDSTDESAAASAAR